MGQGRRNDPRDGGFTLEAHLEFGAVGLVLDDWCQSHVAKVNFAAFGLQADFARDDFTIGGLVHFFPVDSHG